MLVGVEIHGDRLPEGNYDRWPVKRDGASIGRVTIAVYSPRLERNIGYAWVPIEYSGLGTKLTLETPEGETTATVVGKPFVDAKKKIPAS